MSISKPLADPVAIEGAGEADVVATFPDIPEAVTAVETREPAPILSADALATAIEH